MMPDRSAVPAASPAASVLKDRRAARSTETPMRGDAPGAGSVSLGQLVGSPLGWKATLTVTESPAGTSTWFAPTTVKLAASLPVMCRLVTAMAEPVVLVNVNDRAGGLAMPRAVENTSLGEV